MVPQFWDVARCTSISTHNAMACTESSTLTLPQPTSRYGGLVQEQTMIRMSNNRAGDDLDLWISRALKSEVEECCPSDQVWQRISHRILNSAPSDQPTGGAGRGDMVARLRPALTAVCVFEMSCLMLWWKAAFVL
jgi:hypothetical protein